MPNILLARELHANGHFAFESLQSLWHECTSLNPFLLKVCVIYPLPQISTKLLLGFFVQSRAIDNCSLELWHVFYGHTYCFNPPNKPLIKHSIWPIIEKRKKIWYRPKKQYKKKARALLLVIDIWTCFAHSVDFPTSNVTSSFARIMKGEFIRNHQ